MQPDEQRRANRIDSTVKVSLRSNDISDLAALAANTVLGTGDTVYVEANPLDCDTRAANSSTLEARGVNVAHECP